MYEAKTNLSLEVKETAIKRIVYPGIVDEMNPY